MIRGVIDWEGGGHGGSLGADLTQGVKGKWLYPLVPWLDDCTGSSSSNSLNMHLTQKFFICQSFLLQQ